MLHQQQPLSEWKNHYQDLVTSLDLQSPDLGIEFLLPQTVTGVFSLMKHSILSDVWSKIGQALSRT